MKNVLTFILVALTFMFTLTGCIRLTGSAGYTKRGPDDPYPQTKQVGFDTAQLI